MPNAVPTPPLDTGARLGELCAMRLDDLAADREGVVITRRLQARSVSPPVTSRAAIRGWSNSTRCLR
ncbi:hypothetical protein ACFRCG_12770 [Embleya sp. NPDC056575]|uniref:hypothetical protein n=1 Tax=unclassified Embleya TaxID=2699296 RepID=UPI00368A3E38